MFLEIIYECQKNRPWSDYIGKDDVHSMIQFNTAEGPKFYFTTDIEKDLKKGYNLFFFRTEPKNLIVLSKNLFGCSLLIDGFFQKIFLVVVCRLNVF